MEEEQKCECCGKSIGELKPFPEEMCAVAAQYGLNLNGARLVPLTRPARPPNEEAEKEMEAAQKAWEGERASGEPFEEELSSWISRWFSLRYGEEEGEALLTELQLSGFPIKVWHCRDCALLSNEAYFEKAFGAADDDADL